MEYLLQYLVAKMNFCVKLYFDCVHRNMKPYKVYPQFNKENDI